MHASHRLVLAVMLLLLVGCSSSKQRAFDADWSGRIGTFTYDQAVAELGKPNVFQESADALTADWIIRRDPQMTFGFGVGHSSYGGGGSMGLGAGTTFSPPPRGEYLRLVFGADRVLKEWRRLKD